MAIREDLVASAAKFLQDPSVASSPVESKVAFLQAKNLTQEEVNAALARAASESGTAPPSYAAPQQAVAQQGQPYYGQQYPPQYPPYAWQPPPQEIPRRDWRDWFIMATVVSGVGYGLYSLGKRYVYPLVAPPTPERLEQDKKSIDEQFEKAFALVDQLAKDTEELKKSEQARTERVDTAVEELKTVISELRSSNKRREDDAQRLRDDVEKLKTALPATLNKTREATDVRLKEVNTELKSLKTLITQRLNPAAAAAPSPAPISGSYLRPNAAAGGSASLAPATTPAPATATEETEENKTNGKAGEEPKKVDYQDYASTLKRSSPFSSGAPPAKASIPAWQMAMANKSSGNAAAASSSSSQAAVNGGSSNTGEGSGSGNQLED